MVDDQLVCMATKSSSTNADMMWPPRVQICGYDVAIKILLTGILDEGHTFSAGIYQVATGAQMSTDIAVINPCLDKGQKHLFMMIIVLQTFTSCLYT